MNVVLIQPDTIWESKEANFGKVRRLLEGHSITPGSLVVLPEMFAVGFSMNVEQISEETDGPTERFVKELAEQYGIYVIGGLVANSKDGRGLNDALVVSPKGDSLLRYSKLHPFRYAGETNYYQPGETIAVFSWEDHLVAPFICYDLRFPEAYRAAVAKGAQVLITIANFPTARVQHWIDLLKARAIENQAYSIGVNRCGSDPNLNYPGRSLVVNPLGEIIADAGSGEAVLDVEIDFESLLAYRKRFPALMDMRRDLIPALSDTADG